MPTGQANLLSQDHVQNGRYTVWGFDVNYWGESGLLQMPVAVAPPPVGVRVPCEIVRSHASVGGLVVTWIAERKGQQPLLPSPLSASPNLVLSTFRITPSAWQAESAEGEVLTHRFSGEYRYFFVRPIFPWLDGGWCGWTPYTNIPPNVEVVSISQFKQVF
jgi:hypothetical protein